MRRRRGDALPVRLYRRALVILPGEFRRRYAAGMVAMLADEWRERRGLARGALLARALADLVWTAVIERIRGSGGRHGKGAGMRSSMTGGISWLDFKLGFRILGKQPAITLVSGLAMTVTIAVAVGAFSVFQDFLFRPTVPLPEGDRIVSLGLHNADTNRAERRLLHAFTTWRETVRGVRKLSIWRTVTRNIVGQDGQVELASFAMMSASGFEVARVAPLLGRPLLESDELAGAPPVVVLGYKEWVNRFSGDSAVVGRRIQIGRETHTIVGVMPDGFIFPQSVHLWIPFTDHPDDYPMTEGPDGCFVFGRLAPGVTQPQAHAEIAALTSLWAAAHNVAHVRGRVMPYTDPYTGMDGAKELDITLFRLVLGVLTLLVLIPFANVAILVYARTATRVGEMALRSALGASRRRIITQLFGEALVLAVPSAVVGVGIALVAIGRVDQFISASFGTGLPFWAKGGRDAWALGYATGLTLLAAIVSGVVPGLQATGKRMGARLKEDRLRLGRVWTGLVVTQVAITVAAVPLAGWVAWQALGMRISHPIFSASEYLGATITGPPPQPGEETAADGMSGPQEKIEEVVRRLEANPRVTGVALSGRNPSDLFSRAFSDFSRVDIDGVAPPLTEGSHAVGTMAVDPGFFGFLDVPVVSGREFSLADMSADPPPVLVNRSFVREILSGANPIGRRLRDHRNVDEEPAAWREIVGVVDDLTENPVRPEAGPSRIFTPLDRSRMASANLIIHAPRRPGDLIPVIRRVAADVDPELRLSRVALLSEPSDPMRIVMAGLVAAISGILLSLLFLCTAGVFSLMSVSVAQRRREIAIRSALGADPRRVLAGVIVRSARQLAIGVLAGFLVVAVVPPISLEGLPIERDPRLLVAVAVVMAVVGLLSVAGPARRAIRIQPTESLRER